VSELTDILTGRLRLLRLTPNLVDKKATIATLVIDRQPAKAVRLSVFVEGATIATGNVSIAGSTTETLNFTVNDTKVSAKEFSSISGITLDGISNGFITVKAVSKLGQPVNQEKEVYSSLPVRFYAKNAKIRMMAVGQENQVSKYSFMAGPDKDIQENDIATAISQVSLARSQISFVETLYDFDGATHHIEADVQPI